MQHTNAHANRITLRPLSRPPAGRFAHPNRPPPPAPTPPRGPKLDEWL